MKRRGFFSALFKGAIAAPVVVAEAMKPEPPKPEPKPTLQELLVQEFTKPERGSWTENASDGIKISGWKCYAFVEHKKP